MESAQVLRDIARYQRATNQPELALENDKNAMVAAGITPQRPIDNDSFTRLTRNNEKDDWLKRSIRSDAADLYRQQDLTITLDHDYWGSSGAPGYSDLEAQSTMLQIDVPLSDGKMWFRTDRVGMDAGSFNGNDNEKWATCAEHTCPGSHHQRANGASLAAG